MHNASGSDGWQPSYHRKDGEWLTASTAAQLVNWVSSKTTSKVPRRRAGSIPKVLTFQCVQVGGRKTSPRCFWLFSGWRRSHGMRGFHRTRSLWHGDDLKQQTGGPGTQRKNTSLKITVREEKIPRNFPIINCFILYHQSPTDSDALFLLNKIQVVFLSN